MKRTVMTTLVMAAILACSLSVNAADITMTGSDDVGTYSFNTGANWPGGLAPAAVPGDYFTGVHTLRANGGTFAGNSLTLDGPSGKLVLNTSSWALNLKLNGGTLSTSAGAVLNSGNPQPLSRITLLTDSYFGDGTGTLTSSGIIKGPGGLIISQSVVFGDGSGWNAIQSYAGDTVIQNGGILGGAYGYVPWGLGKGNVQIDAGGVFSPFRGSSLNGLSGAGTLNVQAAFAVTLGYNDVNADFSGIVGQTGATGGLTKAGAGTQILRGINTYAGTTTVNGGTLTLGYHTGNSAFGSLVATSPLTFSGTGTFNLDNTGALATRSQSLGALTFSAGEGTVKTTRGADYDQALTFASLAARTAGASGNFVNGGGVNSVNNGFVLTGVAAGFIDKGIFYGGADYASMDGAGTFVRALAYGSDTDTVAADTITADKHVKLTATPGSNQDSISLLTLNLSGGGVGWTQNAGQTLTVPGILKSGGGAVSTISGGTAVTGGAGVELVIRTDAAADQLAISTPITGTGALTKSGAGTLTLNAVNTYDGTTTVNAGTLAYGLSDAIENARAVTVNGGTLDIGSYNDTVGTVTLTAGSITGTTGKLTGTSYVMNNPAAATVSAILAGAVTLTKTQPGLLTLSGANEYTGATTITGGKILLSGDGTLGASGKNLNMNGGALDLGGKSVTVGAVSITWTPGPTGGAAGVCQSGDVFANGSLIATSYAVSVSSYYYNDMWLETIISANLGGSGGMTKSGGSVLVLTGNNTYTGATVINGGAILVTSIKNADGTASSLGAPTTVANGTISISSTTAGGQLNIMLIYAGTGDTTDRVINLSGTAAGYSVLDQSGSGLLKFTSDFTATGAGSKTLMLQGSTTALGEIAGAIVDNSGVNKTSLTKTGSGTWVLSGTSSYTGITTVNAGVLSVATISDGGVACSIGAAANTAANLVLGGGTLRFTAAAGTYTTDRAFTLTAATTSTIEIENAGTTLALAGATSTATTGALIKAGPGTLTLSGVSTYTGATTINAGVLNIASGASLTNNSAVAVNNGGTLAGSGACLGTVTLNGGTITPAGTGANKLTTGNLTLTSGTLDFATSGMSTADPAILTTALNITAASVTIPAAPADGVYRLIQYTSLTGLPSALTVTNPQGKVCAFAADGTYLKLTISTQINFDGGTAGGDWNNSANWNGGAGPVPSANAVLNFRGNSGTANDNTLASGTQFAAISFDAVQPNGAFTLTSTGGNAINMLGNVVNNNAAAQTIDIPLVLDSATREFQATAGDITVSKAISDGAETLGITKTGNNTLTLSAANTYDGATTISAGAVNIRDSAALGATTAGTTISGAGAALELQNNITVPAGETLALNGSGVSSGGALRNRQDANTYAAAITLGSASQINADAGTITLSGGITATAQNLTIGGAAGTVEINSVIATTSGTLTKNDAGTLILNAVANNTYTGTTTINGGVVNIRHAGSLGTIAGNTTVNNGAALQIQGGITTLAEPLILNGTGIANDGALRSISGNNSFAGAVSLGSSGVRINSDTAGNTLTLSAAITPAVAGYDVTFGGSGNITLGAGTLLNAGNVTKDGSGTLTVQTTALTYTGSTLISAGTLKLGTANMLPSTALTVDGATAVFDNNGLADTVGTVTLKNGAVIQGAGPLTSSTLSYILESGTITAPLGAGASTLTKNTSGTVTLSGAGTFTGATTINDGVLIANNATALGPAANAKVVFTSNANAKTLRLNGIGVTITDLTGDANSVVENVTGSATFTVNSANTTSFAGVLKDNGGTLALTKGGVGTLTLSGANAYTGATLISGGVLNIQHDTALGTTAGNTTVNNNCALQLQGGITVGAEPLSINGLGTPSGTGALRNISGNNEWQGTVTLATAARINSDAGTLTLSAANSITAVNLALTLGGAGNGTVSGTITTGTGTLTKDGAGTWTLTGANTYTGNTAVNAGALVLSGANGRIASTHATAALTLANGVTLELDNTVNNNTARLADTGGVTFNGGTFRFRGMNGTASSESLGALTMTAGASTIDIVNGTGAGSSSVVTFSSLGTRTAPATVNFTYSGEGTLGTAGDAPRVFITGQADGAVIPGATVNGTNLAEYTTANGVRALTSFVEFDGAAVQTGLQTKFTTSRTTESDVLTATRSIGSLTITSPGSGKSISLGASGAYTLTVSTGGILLAGTDNFEITRTGTSTGTIAGTSPTFTIADAGTTLTISAPISGANTVTKAGPGKLVLSGANTYTLATTINEGTLVHGANDVIPTVAVNINGAGQLDFNGKTDTVGAVTINATGATADTTPIKNPAGNGTLTITTLAINPVAGYTSQINTGTGTLTLGGAVTFNASTPVTTGRARISGNLDLGAATRTFTIADGTGADYDLLIDANISSASGAYGITKATAGSTLVLSGNNSYSGITTLSAGILRAQDNANALGLNATAAALTLNVASTYLELAGDTGLNFGRNATVSAAMQITSDRVTAGAGVTHTLGTLSIAANVLTIAGGANVTSGTAGLTFGDVTLTGNPTFTVNSPAGGGTTLLTLGAISSAVARNVIVNGTGDTTVTGIMGTLTGTLTKQGTGTLTLSGSGANTSSGLTTVSAGTLLLNKSGAVNAIVNGGLTIGAASATPALVQYTGDSSDMMGTGTVTINGAGQLDFNGKTDTIGNVAIVATGATADTTPITNTAGGGTLTIGTLGITPVAGFISQLNTGTGTLTLGGAVTFTASTTVTTGRAQLSGNLALGAADRTFTVALGTGADYDLLVDAIVSGGDGIDLTKAGAGRLTLTGNNSYTGITTLQGGALRAQGNANALGQGTATVVMNTAASTLQLAGDTGLSFGRNTTVSITGSTITSDTVTPGGAGVTHTLGTLSITGAFTLTVAGGANVTSGTAGLTFGDVTLTGAPTFTVNNPAGGGSTLLTLGAISGVDRNVIVNGTGDTTITGIMSTGTGTLTKQGAGTLTLLGANEYTGLATVSAGVLNIRNATATGTTAGGVTVASLAALQLQGGIIVGNETLSLNNTGIANDGALRNISGNNEWQGTITLVTNPVRINSDAGTLTLSAANSITAANIGLTLGGAGNGTVSGTITTGTGALTKDGAGTWTIGDSTYTGATAVNAGTLAFNGTKSGAGAVTVESGATIGGVGSVAGVVTVKTGARLAPAGSGAIGKLTLSTANAALVFNADAVLDCEIGGSDAVPVNDWVDLTGDGSTVAFGATATVKLYKAAGATLDPMGKTFVLFDYRGNNPTMPTWTIDYGDTGWTGGTVSISGSRIVLTGITKTASAEAGTTYSFQ